MKGTPAFTKGHTTALMTFGFLVAAYELFGFWWMVLLYTGLWAVLHAIVGACKR